MKNSKVLGIGSAMLDVLARVDDSFIASLEGEKGGMQIITSAEGDALQKRLPQFTHEIGGSAANTIFGLANLGIATSLLAKVGDDAEGNFYRKRYEELGGDSSAFKTAPGKRTARCFSLITPDSERTMRTDLAAASEISPADLSDKDFEGITHVHAEGYQLFNGDFLEKSLAMAKKHGCTVSFDLASFEVVRMFRDRIRTILKDYADIVFANEDETAEFIGSKEFSPEDAACELRKLTPCAIVKLGKKGAFLMNDRESARVDAKLVKAVDTTGAGDLWQTGFLYGLLTGRSLEVCGKMGAVVSSQVVSVIGAAIPPAGWMQIKKEFNNL